MKAALQIAGKLLFFAFFAGASSIASYGQTAVSQLIEQGDAAYQVFDNVAALNYYQQALNADSTSFQARIKASRTSYDLGLDYVAESNDSDAFDKFESSILHARALVELFPDSAQSHFLLAATLGNLALFKSGREKVVLGQLVERHSKQAISLDPKLAYPYVSLGIYYREVSSLSWIERTLAKMFFGRLPDATFDKALDYLHTALRLRPNFPFLHFELAMTFLALEQFDNALLHLETLIALNPESSQDARNQAYARRLIEEIRSRAD